MKIVEYSIEYSSGTIKTSTIRSRTDCIILVLELTQWILFNKPCRCPHTNKLSFIIGNIYRVLLSRNNSIHSVVYPFKINFDNEYAIVYSTKNDIKINAFILSQLIAYYKNGVADDDQDPVSDLGLDTIEVINEIESYEDGYLRFDDDPFLANGDLHPRFHYDIFYSNQASIKIGSASLITLDKMIDFINPDSNCHYIVTT